MVPFKTFTSYITHSVSPNWRCQTLLLFASFLQLIFVKERRATSFHLATLPNFGLGCVNLGVTKFRFSAHQLCNSTYRSVTWKGRGRIWDEEHWNWTRNIAKGLSALSSKSLLATLVFWHPVKKKVKKRLDKAFKLAQPFPYFGSFDT